MKKYASWAPRILVSMHKSKLANYHEDIIDAKTIKNHIDLLAALTTHDSMQGVWGELKKKKNLHRFKSNSKVNETQDQWPIVFFDAPTGFVYEGPSDKTNEFNDRSQAVSLYSACCAAKYRYQMAPRWTKREAVKKYGDIEKHADALASLLLELGYRPDGSKIRHELDSIVDYIEDDYISESSFYDSMKELFQGVDSNYLDSPVLYYRFAIDDAVPPLSWVLKRLSEKAKINKVTSEALSQPNAKNADQIFFQQYLSDYFLEFYGLKFHGLVADITNSIYGTDVSEDNVRMLIKSRRRREKIPKQN